jgi:hypothetical protein
MPGGSASQKDTSTSWPSSVWHPAVVVFRSPETRAAMKSMVQSGIAERDPVRVEGWKEKMESAMDLEVLIELDAIV